MAEVETEINPIDAVDVAGETVTEEAPQGDTSTTETPRDDDGRVVETDEASTGDAAPAEPTEEAAETSTDTDQQVVKEQPAELFVYQGDGTQHEITGSKVGEDGSVTIPKDQIPHIRNLLSSGKYFTGTWQREQSAAKQAVETANAERDAQTARSNAISQKLDEIAGLDENSLFEWVTQFQRDLPAIKAEADKALIEQQGKADKDRLAEFEQRDAEQQMLPQLAQGLENNMVSFVNEERFKSLEQQDLQSIYKQLWEGRKTNNVFVAHEGQTYVNRPLLEQAMEYAVKFRRQEARTEQKTVEAQKANEAETGKKIDPPPHVSTKAGPAPTGKVQRSQVEAIEAKPIEEQADAAWDAFEAMDFKD